MAMKKSTSFIELVMYANPIRKKCLRQIKQALQPKYKILLNTNDVGNVMSNVNIGAVLQIIQ